MPNTFTLISTTTVGAGGAASIDLTSIPATYTDLYVTYSLRSSNTGAEQGINMTINGTTSGYSLKGLFGGGNGTGSFSQTGLAYVFVGRSGALATANTFNNGSMYFPNYAGSTNKSFSIDVVNENNTTSDQDNYILAGLWSNTAAINRITLVYGVSANWVAGSTVSIYGVLKGSGGASVA